MNTINAYHETKSSTASKPLTNADGDPGRNYPVGTFSPSSHHVEKSTSENITNQSRHPYVSAYRKDYRKHSRISKIEAADYAGVSVRTIESWIYRKKNPLPRYALRGAYIIALLELDKFLRKGLK